MCIYELREQNKEETYEWNVIRAYKFSLRVYIGASVYLESKRKQYRRLNVYLQITFRVQNQEKSINEKK